jgi:hypothetical protein
MMRSWPLLFLLIWHFGDVNGQPPCRLDLRFHQVPARLVFDAIAQQCGFVFSYGSINDQQKVSIQTENSQIEAVLDMLKPQLGVKYVIKEKYIILKLDDGFDKRGILLSGIVIDSSSLLPVNAATIYSKSLKTLANTNTDGKFEMKIQPGRKWITLNIAKESYPDTTIVIAVDKTTPMLIYIKKHNRAAIDELYPIERPAPDLTTLDPILTDSFPSIGPIRKKGFWETLELDKPDFSNISEVFFSRVSISLIPPISTNKMLAYHTVNNLSFNLLGGNSAGVNGLEVAGIYNYTKGNVNGLQAAGIVNRVSHNVTGIQVAGILNSNSGNMEGIQIGGVINYTADTLLGLQISGFHQQAGVVTGLQATGFYNEARTVSGGQISGFYNQCRYLKGLQLSGFVNYADTLEGVQLGLINVSKFGKAGLGIGLFNYVGNGYHKVEIAYNAEQTLQLGIRSGWPTLYLHYFAGWNQRLKDSTFVQAGFGLASSMPLSKQFSFELDATMRSNRVLQHFEDWQFNFHNQLFMGVTWQPFKKIGLRTGAVLNHFWFKPQEQSNLSYNQLSGTGFYNDTVGDFSHKLWWGWQLSLLFF